MRAVPTRPLLAGGLIVLITLLVYIPAMRGGFIWDDDYYVTHNDTLTSIDGLRRIWFELGATPQYYPLVHTSFWIEYHLWELQPFGYHLVNVLLHIVSALMLWRILRRLGVPGAWWAAAIFAIHPVHVESVAWITERKNVLSGLFYLAAAWAYLRFAGLGGACSGLARRWRFYALALVLFACALLSKTVTCTLPAALLLLLWWKRSRLRRADLLPLIPLLALGLAMGLVTVWMEKHHVGAEGEEWALTFLDRCVLAGRILCFHVGKLLWPQKLAFIYPRWQIDAGVWWQFLFPLAALAPVVVLWLVRRRLGTGPLIAVLFFGGTLFPALGFFDVYPMRYSYVADHFQYLASIGVIVLIVAAVATAFGRLPSLGPSAGPMTGAAALMMLGVLAGLRAGAFTSPEALWRDTVTTNPDAWMAQDHLGRLLVDRGEFAQAIWHYRRALQTKPDGATIRTDLARAFLKAGAVDRAIRQYRRVAAEHPDDPEPRNNLGIALLSAGRPDEAFTQFTWTLELDPHNAPAHNNLAGLLSLQGRMDEAVAHLNEAIRAEPGNVGARCNLAGALTAQGKLEEAAGQYRQALAYRPDDARIRCAWGDVLRVQGKLDEAIEQYRTVLRADPEHAAAGAGLQAALAEQQQP